MNHLKMLGLAAVTAAALMAVLGAGTASATVICKNNLNTEKCSEPYPVGTKGTASLQGSGLIESLEGTVLNTCTGSVVSSTLENAGSATTTVKSGLSSITFTGCSSTVDTIKPGSAELHHIAGTDNGTLTTLGTEVTTQIFGASCTYGTGASLDVGTTVGGNPGSMTLNTIFPRVAGGFICPEKVRFTGKYVATSPTNAWVAAG
jgi:hypothetical protein